MDISNQIKTRREAMGLSQEQLAEKLYVSRQTISNWERDKTYPDVQSLLMPSILFDTSICQSPHHARQESALLDASVALVMRTRRCPQPKTSN